MTSTLPEVLSREDVLLLLDAPSHKSATGKRNRAMLAMMYYCGLRVSEVTALTVRSVNDGLVRVRESKGGGARNVPIPAACLREMQRHVRHANPLHGGALSGPLFPNLRGDRGCIPSILGSHLSTRTVQEMVRRYADSMGLPDWVTPHTLRHSGASHLLESGATIREVQQWLGHKNVSTTMIYTHVNPTRLRAAVEVAFNGEDTRSLGLRGGGGLVS